MYKQLRHIFSTVQNEIHIDTVYNKQKKQRNKQKIKQEHKRLNVRVLFR